MRFNPMLSSKNYFFRGAYSGAIGGIVGSVLFGIYAATTILLFQQGQFTVSLSTIAFWLYLIMIFIVVGSIIAILVGTIGGIIISKVINAYRIIDKAHIIGAVAGCIMASIYPIILILTAIVFVEPAQIKPEIHDSLLSLPGAMLAGWVGGLLAGTIFKKGYNSQL